MKKQHLLIIVLLTTLFVTACAVPLTKAETALAPPTVNLPNSSWRLYGQTAYPDSAPFLSIDPAGSGYLSYVHEGSLPGSTDSEVGINYEKAPIISYNSAQLKSDAESLYKSRYETLGLGVILWDSGTTTYAGVTAGYAYGGIPNAAAPATYKEVVFIKGNYYINVEAYWGDARAMSDVDSIINSISVSTRTLSTKWNIAMDSYNTANFGSNWDPGGNCYGYASTALLYFMHYSFGDSSYPYFPAQSFEPISTSNIVDYNAGNALTNVTLAITFHQLYNPNTLTNFGWLTMTANYEKQQFNCLIGNLTKGIPVILTMKNASPFSSCHAVVAYAARELDNGNWTITVYDPNYIAREQYASFNPNSGTFLYEATGPYKLFIVEPPTMISNSWFSSWRWWLNELDDNYLTENVKGYQLVISDVGAAVKSKGGQDFFTQLGDSESFVKGIVGSCGIEEGLMQVYAIPDGTPYEVQDPTANQADILVTRVTSGATGQLTGYAYLLNMTATQGSLNYTIAPTARGLSINGTTGLDANVAFFCGTNQSTSIFQSSNIPLSAGQIADFTVTNWQALNSTSQSSIALKISNMNQPADTATYNLVNGQSGLPPRGTTASPSAESSTPNESPSGFATATPYSFPTSTPSGATSSNSFPASIAGIIIVVLAFAVVVPVVVVLALRKDRTNANLQRPLSLVSYCPVCRQPLTVSRDYYGPYGYCPRCNKSYRLTGT